MNKLTIVPAEWACTRRTGSPVPSEPDRQFQPDVNTYIFLEAIDKYVGTKG
jgi:hypothetical protein